MPLLPRSRGSRCRPAHYDAVIVGARAAGAAVAMLLARRGLRVLAVDKGNYGSDTLSSHALMRGAVRRLHRWSLLDKIWEAGTPVITRTIFGYDETLIAFDGLGDETIPGLAAPRRTVLDPILVDAAVDAGATVSHATRLVGIDIDTHGRVRGVQVEGAGGSTASITTDLLVGADGLRSMVARQLGATVTRKGAFASAYILQYFTNVDLPSDCYSWLYRPGRAAGLIPTNADSFCVFVALPPQRFVDGARHAPAAAMADGLRQLPPSLRRGLAAGVPTGPIRTWPGVRGQFRRAHGPGWALVGDAGYFKDPFAAHGISDAFRDAELLTEAVCDGDLGRYETDRDDLSMPVFTVLEQIASYDWDMETLPGLHIQLSQAMRDEELASPSSTAGMGGLGDGCDVPLRRFAAGPRGPGAPRRLGPRAPSTAGLRGASSSRRTR